MVEWAVWDMGVVGWELVLDWGMVGLGGCGLLVLQPGLLSRFKASSITYALGGFT